MSFQVGDFAIDDQHTGLLKVTRVMKKRLEVDYLNPQTLDLICHHSILIRHIRHATPEEIAAGHRIDHSVHKNEMIKQGRNASELEVLEMIDVSPNCEVSEIVNNWTTDEQIIEHQLAVIDDLKARIEELVEANLDLEAECVSKQKRIDEQSKLLNFADRMCNLDNSKVLELQAKVNDLNARHNETLNRFEGCLLRNAKMKNENKILVGRIQHLEELLWGVP